MTHGWLPLALLGVPATIGLLGLYSLWLRLVDRPLYDLELVKEKLSRPAARAELRLVVFAPMEVAPADVQARLEHVAAAYRAYDLERGNGVVAHSVALPPPDTLCEVKACPPAQLLPTPTPPPKGHLDRSCSGLSASRPKTVVVSFERRTFLRPRERKLPDLLGNPADVSGTQQA